MLIEIDKQEMRLRPDAEDPPSTMDLAVRVLANSAGFGVRRVNGTWTLTWAFGSISDAWVEVQFALDAIGIQPRTRVVAPPPPRSRSPL